MVNVSDKKITKRTAIAKATMFLGEEIISHFNNDELITKKGPVFQTAIIAGIQGVKKTSEIIPMCHPLLINGVDIDIRFSSCFLYQLYLFNYDILTYTFTHVINS